MKYFVALSFFCVFFFKNTYSQLSPPQLVNPSPVSPNAASLGKYGEVPVGLYTGVPGINIPIYEINSGGIQLPIGLNYHAGGVKVEEIASWVGIGWSLSAGGVISRQVRGIPDEYPGGYLESGARIDDYIGGSMSIAAKNLYETQVSDGIIDSQRDLFYYNFGGESGQFFLDASGKGICTPLSKTKIELGTFLGQDKSWKITTTSGEVYYFTDKESTQTVTTSPSATSSEIVSSWYLTKVRNSSETEEITLEYEPTSYTFRSVVSQTKYIFKAGSMDVGNNLGSTSFSYNTIMGCRLSKIKFKNGQVDFVRNTLQRSDLPSDYALQSIVVKSDNMKFYKRINLYQSYLVSDDTPSSIEPADLHRLVLDSVSTVNVNNIKNETHKFAYNKFPGLPSRNSFSQDFWGFYNGASNGLGLVPTIITQVSSGTQLIPMLIEGANRKTNAAYIQAGMLTSITYPTGGRTEFQYENNRASNVPPGLDVTIRSQITKILADGTSTFYEKSFSVSQGFDGLAGVFADIKVYRVGCPPQTTSECPITLLYFPDGRVVNINTNTKLYLPIGDYRVEADLSGVTNPEMMRNYNLAISVPIGEYNANSEDVTVGGLRVKKITSYNNNGDFLGNKLYKYLNPDSVSKSSGFLISSPSHVSDVILVKTRRLVNDAIVYSSAHYVVISSGSNLPLATTQNSTVGYTYVQEFNDESGIMGKTESLFTMAGDLQNKTFPFPPSTSREWKRGLLKQQKIFRYNSILAKYELIQKRALNYTSLQELTYPGIKIGLRMFGDNVEAGMGFTPYESVPFYTATGWFPLKTDSTYTIDPVTSSVLASVDSYQYNNVSLMPIKTTISNSQGLLKERINAFPHDMISSGRDPNGIYQGMISRNIISPVVEQKEVTNGKTNLQITNYKQPKPNVYVPGTVDVLNVNSGLNETRLRYHEYDDKGNLTSASQEEGMKINYIWSYNRQYPIAEIKNAEYSALVTALGGAIAVSDFAAKPFPTKAEIDAFLLPIRNSTTLFKTAMVTTYIYEPLIGVTNIIDPKGQVTSFVYDSFNRLSHVKDHNGNITNAKDYHYGH